MQYMCELMRMCEDSGEAAAFLRRDLRQRMGGEVHRGVMSLSEPRQRFQHSEKASQVSRGAGGPLG